MIALTHPHPFLVIAVDGGAASGKSSTSRLIARQCHFLHVDTGAHYRAVTAAALAQGIEIAETPDLFEFLQNLQLGTNIDENAAMIALNGAIPTNEMLRSCQVNASVSGFAALPAVRNAVKTYQQSLAEVARKAGFHGLIMDGRDIGTVIFPNADLKIFLKADPETRAARRAVEGQTDSVTRRDRQDETRRTAPLIAAEDAVVIDNSNLSLEAVVEVVLKMIECAIQELIAE